MGTYLQHMSSKVLLLAAILASLWCARAVQAPSSAYFNSPLISSLLNTTGFWTEPSCRPRMVLDGVYWILEAHEQKRYHPVFRHSPDAGESLRRCCDFLLDLSSLKKERRY